MKLVAVAAIFATTLFAGDQKLGKPLSAGEPISISVVIAKPDQYVGKTIQVKGKVSEVCQMAGCWMNLTDGEGHLVRIKVDDGVLVFPKNSVGKIAIAEGKLEKHDLTRDQIIAQSQHEAAESGRPFNSASVKAGKTIYMLAGTGAIILDK